MSSERRGGSLCQGRDQRLRRSSRNCGRLMCLFRRENASPMRCVRSERWRQFTTSMDGSPVAFPFIDLDTLDRHPKKIAAVSHLFRRLAHSELYRTLVKDIVLQRSSGGALPPLPTAHEYSLLYPLVRATAQAKKSCVAFAPAIQMMAAPTECSNVAVSRQADMLRRRIMIQRRNSEGSLPGCHQVAWQQAAPWRCPIIEATSTAAIASGMSQGNPPSG